MKRTRRTARDPVVVEEEIVKIAIVKRTNVECTRNISVCMFTGLYNFVKFLSEIWGFVGSLSR